MNKNIICLLALIPATSFGQGLFDIAPNDEATESKRTQYTVGIRAGWDSNISPESNDETDSATIGAYITAKTVRVGERSIAEFYGRAGVNYNFEDDNGQDNEHYNINAGFNYSYVVSERLRFSSRNNVGYQLEPDYANGFASTRSLDEYFTWSTDNSVGYKLSPKTAIVLGFRLNGVEFDSDNERNDRSNWSVYAQGRYTLNETSIATLDYSFGGQNNEGELNGSETHTVALGLERRFSTRTVAVVKVGAQFLDVDGRDSGVSPYLELAVRHQASDRTSVRGFAKYGFSNFDTSFANGSYDENENLQLGISARHQVNSRLNLSGGISYILNQYSESPAPGNLPDEDVSLLNLNLGFGYSIGHNLTLTGSVNHTLASSDIDSRDYNRTRLLTGIEYAF